ncbi:MAG: hypothetical protein IJ524_07020 [Bacteroidales bacterium]|nr:hypothetical protein [Bacteroidales bacterium]
MKRLVILLVLLPLGLRAQTKDSAELVVERYLKLLNLEALPQDSTLVMESTVTFPGSTDTFTMRRWYAPPTMMRVEVWHDNQLTEGYCTNGSSRHREYMRRMRWWDDVDHSVFHQKMDAFDFRGQLYNWQVRGVKLSYRGEVNYKGQQLQVVRAEQTDAYARYYMFEKGSGLLVIVQEKDEEQSTDFTKQVLAKMKASPMEYEVFHEYLPAGMSLVPSQVSYMRDGQLTVMETTLHFEPRNNLTFNQD